jgi:tetratricopeptide (TPR) repeat protein
MAGSKRILIPGIILLLVLFFTYSNHFDNPFQFDDAHTIVTNNAIRDIKNIPRFFKDATTTSSLPANQAYRPGLTTLNTIDYWIGGKPEPDPFYYHVSIFISYVLLGVLLYLLALDIFNRSLPHRWNPWFALFAAGFYTLHTANAETINYIIARSDSFSTFMIVLGLVTYIYKPSWRKYYIYLIPVLIGFFVKEPAVMFVPLLFVYIVLFEKQFDLMRILVASLILCIAVALLGGLAWVLFPLASLSLGYPKAFLVLLIIFLALFSWLIHRKKILSKLLKRPSWPAYYETVTAVLPAFMLVVLLYLFSRAMTPVTWTGGGGPFHQYIMTQAYVTVHYFNNFLLPVNLSADTDWTLITRIWDDRVLTGAAFIFILFILALWGLRRNELRPIAFGIAWFFLGLMPTALTPLAEVLNDHRTFLPYIGLVIAVTWAIAQFVISYEGLFVKAAALRVGLVLVLCGVLAGHALGTHHRNNVWSTGESLWKDVTLKSPGNARGWMNYGNALMAKAQYDDALKCYLRAKEIWPYYSYVYINLGILKGTMNNQKEAEENFRLAIQYNPNNPEAYYYFANWLKTRGRLDEAQTVLNQGLAVSPGHNGMQNLQAEMKLLSVPQGAKLDLAIAAASNKPTPENYLALSLEFYLAAKYEKCVEAAKEAIKLKPDYAEAWNNICSAYNQMGQYEEAEKACKRSLEIKPGYELAKNNLIQVQQRKNVLDKALKGTETSKTPETYLELSLTYYYQANYRKCIEAAQEALKLRPNYDLAYNNICTAYNMLGEWDQAIEAGEKAVALNPANQLAKNNLAEAKRKKALGAQK